MTARKPLTKEQRTKLIIDREVKHDHAWHRLHAILCMDLGWPFLGKGHPKMEHIIDKNMVAKAMGDLNG